MNRTPSKQTDMDIDERQRVPFSGNPSIIHRKNVENSFQSKIQTRKTNFNGTRCRSERESGLGVREVKMNETEKSMQLHNGQLTMAQTNRKSH